MITLTDSVNYFFLLLSYGTVKLLSWHLVLTGKTFSNLHKFYKISPLMTILIILLSRSPSQVKKFLLLFHILSCPRKCHNIPFLHFLLSSPIHHIYNQPKSSAVLLLFLYVCVLPLCICLYIRAGVFPDGVLSVQPRAGVRSIRTSPAPSPPDPLSPGPHGILEGLGPR